MREDCICTRCCPSRQNIDQSYVLLRGQIEQKKWRTMRKFKKEEEREKEKKKPTKENKRIERGKKKEKRTK